MKRIHFAIFSILLIALFIGVAFSVGEVAKRNFSIKEGQSVLDYVKILNFKLIGGKEEISMDELFKGKDLLDINYELNPSVSGAQFVVDESQAGNLRVYLTKKGYTEEAKLDWTKIALVGSYAIQPNSALELVESVESFSGEGDSKLVDASELYFEYVRGSYFSANYKGYELKRTAEFRAHSDGGKTGIDANVTFRYGSKFYSAQLIAMPCVGAKSEPSTCFNVYSVGAEATPVVKDPANVDGWITPVGKLYSYKAFGGSTAEIKTAGGKSYLFASFKDKGWDSRVCIKLTSYDNYCVTYYDAVSYLHDSQYNVYQLDKDVAIQLDCAQAIPGINPAGLAPNDSENCGTGGVNDIVIISTPEVGCGRDDCLNFNLKLRTGIELPN